ncbi:hypothetical protein [Microbacter margulisiae]|uniref:TM2 domain-containing membrane protein YozV n=1 Tax=Microbacter margulisiae TaxID=1350067 RepID=A0A7W5H168_9PORP|nr:hypothetical protein [Microbacter margulisiae]MBB3186047.1 TM2 domain-containing membrane protein YozV [Microbacter margulisiae]
MKIVIPFALFFLASIINLYGQNNTTPNFQNLRESSSQRIILAPAKPVTQKQNEINKTFTHFFTSPLRINDLHINTLSNELTNPALPSQWKTIMPSIDMGLQAIYLTDHKDPVFATSFSIMVPGMGQIYNGQIGKGLVFMATSYGGLAVGAVALSSHHSGLATAGFITAAISYIWSIVDAGSTSNSINRKNNLAHIAFNPNKHLAVFPSISTLEDPQGNLVCGTTNAGLAVAYNFGDK